jgi:hypothetical protein
MEKQEWTIKDLERAYLEQSLPMCNSDFERCNLKAIHGIEQRRLADYWQSKRKLTPGEVAIAQKYGWKG